MIKVGHPALEMPDITSLADAAKPESPDRSIAAAAHSQPATLESEPMAERIVSEEQSMTPEQLAQLKESIKQEIVAEVKASLTRDIVAGIIQTLGEKFLGEKTPLPASPAVAPAVPAVAAASLAPTAEPAEAKIETATAAERIGAVVSFAIRKEKCQAPVWTVKLGATREQGGTRGRTYAIGGETSMPFHLWEGEMPNRPLLAMEVFDAVSEKYPAVLREIYGDLLQQPAEMARHCVEQYGADLISVRLEATHPEKGNRTAEQAVELVKQVLATVDVPLIITGHSHYERNNQVLKAVAQACAGENLLLNWVEQDNYRTIAGAAIAYGHAVVSQSPIDVNIAKQMNILLTNMDVKPEQIVMDPMTGAVGYGIEYTYSVMERIRYTGLNGDKMLAGPMILSPGQECIKIKEFRASETDFPQWGELAKRAALWEIATAQSFLFAGANILICYHPQTVQTLKKSVNRLLDKR